MEVPGLTESVLQYLRVHIITCDFAPGEKLNEPELSSRLGISRSPLREAFRVLQNEDLIANFPRKGCYVTDISLEKCKEIYEIREMIECFSVDLLEARGIRELPEVASVLEKTAHLQMPDANVASDKFDYLRAIADVHIKLVEAAGNTRLDQFFNSIFPSLARYQSMYTYVPGLMDRSHEEHKRILNLITMGKYQKAKDLLRAHIKRFVDFIASIMDKENSTRAANS
jgi:DNA-binding GntR family transcriptional regulator